MAVGELRSARGVAVLPGSCARNGCYASPVGFGATGRQPFGIIPGFTRHPHATMPRLFPALAGVRAAHARVAWGGEAYAEWPPLTQPRVPRCGRRHQDR